MAEEAVLEYGFLPHNGRQGFEYHWDNGHGHNGFNTVYCSDYSMFVMVLKHFNSNQYGWRFTATEQSTNNIGSSNNA
jgi:hypothetical protein